MYSRRLGERVLSFGHEGILYKDSFLMYDHHTRSVWVHVTGECIIGDLKGRQMKFFPSSVTTWADWKRRHPNTLVLAEKGRPNFLGTFLGMHRKRLDEFSISLALDGNAKAYPLAQLRNHPVVNDAFAETAVLVVFSNQLRVGNMWNRGLRGHVLRFALVEETAQDGLMLRDEQTGSLWRGLDGVAVEGSLKGTRLRPLTHHPILTKAFRAFYPDGQLYRAAPPPASHAPPSP